MLERTDARTEGAKDAPCILVVEDEQLVRDLAERVLSMHGFRVLSAPEGRSALELFQTHGAAIDLVLLDLTMPGLSGAEVFEKMVAQRPDARVLITSGYAEEEGQTLLKHPAVVGFLGKPYRIDRLLERVQSALPSGRRHAS
jgi:two-component system, cell cycle sensor histidine kinase and response regulator CckA